MSILLYSVSFLLASILKRKRDINHLQHISKPSSPTRIHDNDTPPITTTPPRLHQRRIHAVAIRVTLTPRAPKADGFTPRALRLVTCHDLQASTPGTARLKVEVFVVELIEDDTALSRSEDGLRR